MAGAFQQKYGEWAIVTGASSGIGEAFAHALAERGLRPLLVARRADELARVAADVQARHGVACEVLSLDLADPAFIDQLLAACEGRDVGLVVANAGYNPAGDFLSMPRDMLTRILDVNDKANMLLAHAFLPRLKARGGGGFLLVASTEAYIPTPFSSAYSASKAFVLHFGQALWGEFLDTGVDITVLCPGATDTPLLATRDMGGHQIAAMAPLDVANCGLDYLGQGPSIVPGDRKTRIKQSIMNRLPRTWLLRKSAPIVRAMVERTMAKQALQKHAGENR